MHVISSYRTQIKEIKEINIIYSKVEEDVYPRVPLKLDPLYGFLSTGLREFVRQKKSLWRATLKLCNRMII